MLIIFLDLDGVITTMGKINPIRVEIVKKVIKESGASVVLSSTWRLNAASYALAERIIGNFYSFTPDFPNAPGNDDTERRGYCVQAWLKEHPEVQKYAIIDDSALFLPEQEPNLFRTSGSLGITDEIADKVIEHFK